RLLTHDRSQTEVHFGRPGLLNHRGNPVASKCPSSSGDSWVTSYCLCTNGARSVAEILVNRSKANGSRNVVRCVLAENTSSSRPFRVSRTRSRISANSFARTISVGRAEFTLRWLIAIPALDRNGVRTRPYALPL